MYLGTLTSRSQIARVFQEYLANTSTQSLPHPSTLPPPGVCTDEEYAPLKKEVGDSKADCGTLRGKFGSGRCEPGDSPAIRAEKSAAWKRQAIARNHRDGKCFGGGDDGHQQQAAECWNHVSKCVKLGV